MGDSSSLTDFPARLGGWWSGLDRGWQAVLFAHAVAVLVVLLP